MAGSVAAGGLATAGRLGASGGGPGGSGAAGAALGGAHYTGGGSGLGGGEAIMGHYDQAAALTQQAGTFSALGLQAPAQYARTQARGHELAARKLELGSAWRDLPGMYRKHGCQGRNLKCAGFWFFCYGESGNCDYLFEHSHGV